jgi:sugar-specific transcriptional regulator TrmB
MTSSATKNPPEKWLEYICQATNSLGVKYVSLPEPITTIFKNEISDSALQITKIDASIDNLSNKIDTREKQLLNSEFPPHIKQQLKGANATVWDSQGRSLITTEIAELKNQILKLKNDKLTVIPQLIELMHSSFALIPQYQCCIRSEENSIIFMLQTQVVKHTCNFLKNRLKHSKATELSKAKKAEANSIKQSFLDTPISTLNDVKINLQAIQELTSKGKGKAKSSNLNPKANSKKVNTNQNQPSSSNKHQANSPARNTKPGKLQKKDFQ